MSGLENARKPPLINGSRLVVIMKQVRGILGAPFFLTLLAAAFCIWVALGNDVNFCATTGCTLYEDFSFFGISLWWIGAGAFGVLALAALFGLARPGAWLAALMVLADCGFLLLMALTAPCVSCLAAAAFFAGAYLLFRRGARERSHQKGVARKRHSVLLWVWLALFVVNLGAVARSQLDVWPILDEGGDAKTRMFFSPACPHCVEGINALSGRLGVAFYPVADNDSDIYRIARMKELLGEGMSMAEALAQSAEYEIPALIGQFSPSLLILRLHLLRNKAHIFASNSRGVPFFEERGLPAGLKTRINARERKTSILDIPKQDAPINRDPTLPIDDGTGQCAPGAPCPQGPQATREADYHRF